MIRTFTIETSEADEKALAYNHAPQFVEFAFNSALQSIINGSREAMIRAERQRAQETGEALPLVDDAIILGARVKDAATRIAEAEAKAEVERLERERTKPLTSRQLRLGLVTNGFALAQVEAAIDALPDGADRDKARIEWQYAGEFKRDHPLLVTIAAQLGISAEQFETMWAEAQKL